MISYVIDTHTLFWHLIQSPKLGAQARSIFESAARGEAVLVVPTIVLAELLTIYEKRQPQREFLKDLNFLKTSDQFRLVPIDPDHIAALPELNIIPELHDRMIVACAKILGAACVTTDSRIVQSKLIETIW